ncbi:hypothetical protein OG767_16695 [Micromonospora sp. NBC_01392]|uniref:hypothetical protein n=1 Tax=Micromonospora sp. NBC_01392 TaxID=2903588 RepID=UPI00324DCE2E
MVYARASLVDQRVDVDRSVAWDATWATGQELAVSRLVSEVGSTLDGRRKEFLDMLRDLALLTVLVQTATGLAGLVSRT